MGLGIWGVPAEVMPDAVIVWRIYGINIRQIRTQQQLLQISAEVMPNSVIVLRFME